MLLWNFFMTLIRVLGATVKLQIQHTDLVPQIVFKIVKTSEKSFLAHFYSKKSYLYSSRKGGEREDRKKWQWPNRESAFPDKIAFFFSRLFQLLQQICLDFIQRELQKDQQHGTKNKGRLDEKSRGRNANEIPERAETVRVCYLGKARKFVKVFDCGETPQLTIGIDCGDILATASLIFLFVFSFRSTYTT